MFSLSANQKNKKRMNYIDLPPFHDKRGTAHCMMSLLLCYIYMSAHTHTHTLKDRVVNTKKTDQPKNTNMTQRIVIHEYNSQGVKRFYSYFVPLGGVQPKEYDSGHVLTIANKVKQFASWRRTIHNISVIWDAEYDTVFVSLFVNDVSFAKQCDLQTLATFCHYNQLHTRKEK